MKNLKRTLKYFVAIILGIVVYISTSISPVLIFDYEAKKNMHYTKIGHRGAAGLAPENTLSAISLGLENSVDRIEIDVQQSKDSVIVLKHDITLDRTTNGEGLVKDKTYSELAKLDAGLWFDKKFKNEKIPTLEDAIKEVIGKSKLIIEIKKGNNFYDNIEEQIIEIINRNNYKQWCIIHSFDSEVLERIHQKDPSIELHKLLFVKFSLLPLIFDNGFNVYDFNKYSYIDEYSINYKFANKRFISKIHSLGKKVNVWTVNNSEVIKELIAIGVDGIITDFPNRLK